MVIGREKEQQKLLSLLKSEESQFVAVYGRRRVGKTYLIRQTFANSFTFDYSGVFNQKSKRQQNEFVEAIRAQGYKEAPKPKDWFDVFRSLSVLIEKSRSKKKVIFLDEIQWMDNPRSSFLSAFEHFWNGWASARKDVLLIICGSASSWIINKVFKNRGGLYNRVNLQIGLDLFTLSECEQYVKANGLNFSRNEILMAYMAIGGVPYYWSLLDKKLSVAQNIDELFFSQKGQLHNEFVALYYSMFSNPDPYIDVITALGSKKCGMTRDELLKALKRKDDGSLTRILENLSQCDFIRKYYSFGKKAKGVLYQLIDSYTLFYFKFIKGKNTASSRWLKIIDTPQFYAWRGLAFEQVCLLHIEKIKEVIGIADVACDVCSWQYKGDDDTPGTQIDLLIDRSDGVINLCEMKCTDGPFKIDKDYAMSMKERKRIFIEKTKTRKTVRTTMVTSGGLADNQWSREIPNQIVAESLF